ncbi:MAG: glycosyltransferase family 4 protein [Candidatus Helarchaeota archaeon]
MPSTDGCGGAETFGEELYPRLAQRGHRVVVYCRKYIGENKRYPKSYKSLKLIHFPTIKKQGIDTLIHSFLCTFHIIIFNTGKIIHIHNGGNSIWVPFLRLFRKKCFIGIDGLDWNRKRWPIFVRLYLKITNYLAFKFSNKVIVDNIFVQRYYLEKHGVELDYIPYGVNIRKIKTKNILDKLKIKKDKYILFVGRFIKEKGVHYLIRAFEKVETDFNLVLVGDNLFDKKWVNKLKSTEDKRIIFTGYMYGHYVDELIQNCYLYVQPSDVEGLSPVILRVMGFGKCVLSSDIPENKFLVENNGYLFKNGNIESLRDRLQILIKNEKDVKQRGRYSQKFVKKNFSWDEITKHYLKIFSTS